MNKAIIVHADSRKLVQSWFELGFPKIVLLLTDPPYVSAKQLTTPTKYKGKVINIKELYHGSFEMVMYNFDEILKNDILEYNANIVTFIDRGPSECAFLKMLANHGFVFKQKLYLLNKTPMPQVRKVAFRNGIQEAIWAKRGDAPFNFLSQTEMKNVFETMSGMHKETEYPTEKPLHMFEILVRVLSNENDWVFDPYCGSGTTTIASLKHNRNVVCVDISEKAIETIKKRMEKYGFSYELLRL